MEATDPASFPKIERFAGLAASILTLPPSCGAVRLVAIDGPGGAGKSTFATRLAATFGEAHAVHAQVVHTDDFAGWDNQFDWFPRLIAQLVEPLASGRPGRYQRYDWVKRQLAEWHDVPIAPVVIIEGVGSARRQITEALAFTVWVQTPADLRLARGLERDGEDMLGFWQQWIAGENTHFALDDTRDRANLMVDGNPSIPHDPDIEFVRLDLPQDR